MSLSKVNNYGIGDNNFTSFQETLDRTRRGLSEVTLSEYDTDAAPVVKVGSVFENNGAFFEVITADETPTGYAGISNSTTFYLYFDESAEAFIYSSAAPTWVDARQGWYNGNDRALFSMYKDSGGTLYEDKAKLLQESDRRINDGSGNGIVVDGVVLKDKNITAEDITGVDLEYYRRKSPTLIQAVTYGALFTALSPFVPTVGDMVGINGFYAESVSSGNSDPFHVIAAERLSLTVINIYGSLFSFTGGSFSILSNVLRTASQGSSTVLEGTYISV